MLEVLEAGGGRGEVWESKRFIEKDFFFFHTGSHIGHTGLELELTI